MREAHYTHNAKKNKVFFRAANVVVAVRWHKALYSVPPPLFLAHLVARHCKLCAIKRYSNEIAHPLNSRFN
jgi:hypothetical protein